MTTKRSHPKSSKKKSNKTSPSKRSTGGAAVEKGRSFEDQVAELYRLLGARVTQNIEIHQKKVDILAIFRIPGSSREHTVIVECKDEQRSVAANQRIMAFKGLLDVARKDGIADSAEIVTRVPWSDQAKGFAKTSGVELFTYTEKISQLIDLTPYLKGLVSKFDKGDPGRPTEPPLGSYYVDLSAQKGAQVLTDRASAVRNRRVQRVKGNGHIPVIDTYIHQWLLEDSNRQLAIFGEYGSGKSTLCQKLARDLALSHLNDPSSSRIPILLNLREFVGKLDIEAYITAFLDRECNVVNPRIELFRAMNEAGIFLMIFDGFDEMAVKVDADTLESNLIEIEKLASSKRSRTLLTSRPEYFVSVREESEALRPGMNPFLNREAEYEPLKILPWNEDQVEQFLQRRVPLVKGADQPWTYYRDQIKRIGSLSDLSQRPVLLDMIVKTLPRLISSGDAINLPNLYKNYLLGEMKRQKVLKKRSFLLSDDDRLQLLQDLAVDIYQSPTLSLTFIEAQKRIEKDLKPPKHELEAHTRDFLTNSFLIRQDDEYRLSHKSILEYLVAMRLNKEIETDHPDVFGDFLIGYEVQRFLKELEPNTDTLFRWIQLTKGGVHGESLWLGTNAANLLNQISHDYFAGKDLSDTNLRRVDLSYADLRGTRFKNARLTGADLMSAKLFKKDILPSKIFDAFVSLYVLKIGPLRKYDSVMFFRSLNEELTAEVGMPQQLFREDLFFEVVVFIKDLPAVESFREQLSTHFKTKVAVYFDECEELVREWDSAKLKNKPRTIRKSAR
jgi:NACHT domain/Pentapeptide repeats (8 copies)/Restriction endonuclease